MPFGHPLLGWLSVLSAVVISKYRPRNGRTAYERMTGHRVKHVVVPFGENIMAQFTAHKTAKNDFDTQWIAVYILGVETSSGSYLVANQDGIFKIANTRRGPNESAFDKGNIDEAKLGHFVYVSNGASTSLRAPPVVRALICMPNVNRNVPVPRIIMLRQADFNGHGLTAG